MDWLKVKGKTANRISIKNLLFILVVGIFIVAGAGISGIWANDDRPENDWDDHQTSYQNTAQAQKAHDVAIRATLQDPDVVEAIAKAKESGTEEDRECAKKVFRTTYKDYKEEISEMRSSGTGWGVIVQHFNLHPSILGRGHNKYSGDHHYAYSKHNNMQSEIEAATARSYKGEDADGHYGRGESPDSNDYGLSRHKGSANSNGRGLALGHSKGNGNTSLSGYSAGPGKGNANGHGGGNGNGNGGGNGNGHGGGNGNGNGGGNGNGHGGGKN